MIIKNNSLSPLTQMIFATLLSASSVAAYSFCVASNDIYANNSAAKNIPLVRDASLAVIANGVQTPIVISSGTVSVVDGCSFRIDNLVFQGSANGAFYGGLPANPSYNAVRLSETVIPSGKSFSGVIPFITTPGSWVSYGDFVQFRLFDPLTNTLLATATLPTTSKAPVTGPVDINSGSGGGVVVPPPGTTPTITSASGTSVPTSTGTTAPAKSAAEPVTFGFGLVSILALILA